MPTVWVREHPKRRRRFHASPDCRQLRKGPSRGEAQRLLAVDLNDIDIRPCLTCYPDAPRVVIFKAYCPICESRRPCAHNGAVQVIDRAGRHWWAWPDNNQMPYYRRRLVDQP